MQANAFIGQSESPSDHQLTEVLGTSRTLWDKLLATLATKYGISGQEWNSYSKKAGWSLKLKRGSRTIVYLSPCEGTFWTSFILGEKALLAARKSGLSPAALKLLRQAKKYPEGWAIRLEVASASDLDTIAKLTEAKIAN